MRYADIPVAAYLPGAAWKQLREFTARAERSALRPRDWRMFYDFVQCCHRHRAPLTRETLTDFLLNNGFPHELAGELGAVYLHGRGLLAGGNGRTAS